MTAIAKPSPLSAWARWRGRTARDLGLCGVFLIVMASLLIWIPPESYMASQLVVIFILGSAALSWNWISGFVGHISFGHASMFGIGGFVTAIAINRFYPWVPPWLAWLIGGVTAGVFSVAWGYAGLRLSGPYFIITTIAVAEATRIVGTYWDGFTGGASGTSITSAASLSALSLYWWALLLLAVCLLISIGLMSGKRRRTLLALKADTVAAEEVGVRSHVTKLKVFFLSAMFTGVAGGLYASYYTVILPKDMFGFDRSIAILLMGVIGGVGTIAGPLLGAAVFVMLRTSVISSFPQYHLAIYGGLLLLVILFEPLGVTGVISRVGRWVRPLWRRALKNVPAAMGRREYVSASDRRES